ncbi:hypothetical protein FBU30_008692 [Linnemannia zychae]|nr:hypothetical protein FBU30_008692 [Linnemannia zychae]
MVDGCMGAKRKEGTKVVIGIGLGQFSSSKRLSSLHSSFETYFVQKARALGYIVVVVNEYYTSKKCPTCNNFVAKTESIRRLYCRNCRKYMHRDAMAGHNIANVILGHLVEQKRLRYLQPVTVDGKYPWDDSSISSNNSSTPNISNSCSMPNSGKSCSARVRKRAVDSDDGATIITNGDPNIAITSMAQTGTEGAGFRQNCSEYVQIDRKVFFAAADRNKDVILEQLKPILSNAHQEVGSGSGQHTHHFSKSFPNVTFQPTEYDTALLASIDAYAADLVKEGHHIRPALQLDATDPNHWDNILHVGQTQLQQEQSQGKDTPFYDLVIVTNVFHISPWIVSQSIIRGAGRVLKSGGRFVVYGPFKRDGTFNTESNREFDKTLRGRDASWGIRDVEEIEATAAEDDVQLRFDQVVDMPANNYILFFTKI